MRLPNKIGIVTAAGSGVTGGTGVSGAFTADNLIDLLYSLDGEARLLPGVGWMMNGASVVPRLAAPSQSLGRYSYFSELRYSSLPARMGSCSCSSNAGP